MAQLRSLINRPFPDSLPQINWPQLILQEFGQYPAVKAYLDARYSAENDDAESVCKRLYELHYPTKKLLSDIEMGQIFKGLEQEEVWPPLFKVEWKPESIVDFPFLICASGVGNLKLMQFWVMNGYVTSSEAFQFIKHYSGNESALAFVTPLLKVIDARGTLAQKTPEKSSEAKTHKTVVGTSKLGLLAVKKEEGDAEVDCNYTEEEDFVVVVKRAGS